MGHITIKAYSGPRVVPRSRTVPLREVPLPRGSAAARLRSREGLLPPGSAPARVRRRRSRSREGLLPQGHAPARVRSRKGELRARARIVRAAAAVRCFACALSALSLLLLAAPAALAQQAPGAGAWQTGPAASGDKTSISGVIDSPASGATLTQGTLQLGGWFVDQTAQGWAGADDVEVFAGSMESGKPLGHAQFAQNRPDVAAALKNAFWAASGWSASVSTLSLPPGQTTLSVYVHTPARGWWLRQVNLTLRAPTVRLTPTPTPTPSALGNDISYPQCPTGAEPSGPAFAIVGVTGGRPFSPNPCLAREFAWALSSSSPAQAHVGLYMNAANPGPQSPNWPNASSAAPRACASDWNSDCAYDYGWLAAQDAYARAVLVVGTPAAAQYPWWLDVEAANSWSNDQTSNASAVQGALDYLRSANIASLGVYSTSTDWEALIGSPSTSGPLAGLLNWRPGPSGAQDAPAWCNRTVTGGRVKFVQFPAGGFDTDFACF